MRIVVTGSSGLVGSEVVAHFHDLGWDVHGIDSHVQTASSGTQNNKRWNQQRLESVLNRFRHHEVDIRDRKLVFECLAELRPDAIVHTSPQPVYDLAAQHPFDDFDINAAGTLNLLEAARQFAGEAAFVFMSSNKVYGNAPDDLPLVEQDTRWEYARPEDFKGVREDMRIDRSTHSIFGASKVAADVMVQEYGRYFGMKTCCLRAGCLTGPNPSENELHGFLSRIINANLSGEIYYIYGYKGKQVRDNIHSQDVARFIEMFISNPRAGEVYNLGGGRRNSCSILEAFEIVESITGNQMNYEYVDKNRAGDHICYISDLTKTRLHYPEWDIMHDLPSVFDDLYRSWRARYARRQGR